MASYKNILDIEREGTKGKSDPLHVASRNGCRDSTLACKMEQDHTQHGMLLCTWHSYLSAVRGIQVQVQLCVCMAVEFALDGSPKVVLCEGLKSLRCGRQRLTTRQLRCNS
jgi:hypothetical protein